WASFRSNEAVVGIDELVVGSGIVGLVEEDEVTIEEDEEVTVVEDEEVAMVEDE
ncbi:hypothetical protein KI387_038624, partial [Taxus chinensis]